MSLALSFKHFSFLAIGLLFLWPTSSVFAAETFFTTGTRTVTVGDLLELSLFLDTEGESINAVEGGVAIPAELFDLREIRDGNSMINFWLERPTSESNGIILFSGIIPGGYIGQNGPLLSLLLEAKKSGYATIRASHAKVFRNDGKGSSLTLTPRPITIYIGEGTPLQSAAKLADADPPEPFEPALAKTPDAYEGRVFVVFATQDKKSGIDHYEVQLGTAGKPEPGRWERTESPYILADEGFRGYVYVKAVDRAGNERIEQLSLRGPMKWYDYIVIFLVVIGILFVAQTVARKREKMAH